MVTLVLSVSLCYTPAVRHIHHSFHWLSTWIRKFLISFSCCVASVLSYGTFEKQMWFNYWISSSVSSFVFFCFLNVRDQMGTQKVSHVKWAGCLQACQLHVVYTESITRWGSEMKMLSYHTCFSNEGTNTPRGTLEYCRGYLRLLEMLFKKKKAVMHNS